MFVLDVSEGSSYKILHDSVLHNESRTMRVLQYNYGGAIHTAFVPGIPIRVDGECDTDIDITLRVTA